ncbi:AAA family ATPase [Streptomyces sp. NPDC093097]|uniref:AAA family ATPase n=1 Tax=Streptomyces sp. NPDC093097 TaxID=3366027 RepID=UPI0037F198E6
MLVGREEEQDELDRLLAAARKGHGGALVLRGPAGIGKSVLLNHLMEQAEPDVRVLRATGVEGEAELSFAALHQLMRPLLPALHTLQRPQSAALEGAFGLGTAPADRFLVALAALTLLSDASEDGPLLLLVDDAHWLDSASADALLFVARRLEAEGVALVMAARDGSHPFPAPGVPDLRIGPLEPAAAARLLARALPDAAPITRQRLLHEAGGNPLALVELPLALCPDQRAGSVALPEHLPLNERLQQVFWHRARALAGGGDSAPGTPGTDSPDPEGDALLLAAAENDGDLTRILSAAPDTDRAINALSNAAGAGLLTLDQHQVRFRHPLVRSAVYQGAPLSRRRAAHLALARAFGTDDDRRIWHLAAAAVGTDDTVARQLAALAERIRRTGGVATAAQTLRRAAALSSVPRDRARRLVDAAECAWTAAETAQAQALLDQAEALTDDPVLRAHCARVRGAIIHASSDPATALRVLLDGARPVLDEDPELAAEMLVMAARSAWVAADPAQLRDIGELCAQLHPDRAPAAGQFARHFRYLGSLATDGTCPGRPDDRNIPGARTTWLSPAHPRPWVWPPVFLPYMTGSTEPMLGAHQCAVDALRKAGAAGALPMGLAPLIALELLTGQWPAAVAHGEEALTLADETGQLGVACHVRAILAWAAAAQGDAARCRELAETALSDALPRRITSAIALAHCALGHSALAERRPDSAVRLLGEVINPGGPAEHFMVSWLILPDLVEAHVRLGTPEPARAALARFEGRATPEHLPHLHATWYRCRALLAPDDEAAALYTAALQAAGPSAFDIGRTHFLYGEWLRRNRRIRPARDHLHQAATYLGALGARPWTELIHSELRAAGDRGPEDTTTDPTAGIRLLTPREHQIARLAAQGMSNGDIAAQLFLSPRTVAYHLHKAFPKLGIISRTQLSTMPLE